jgi:hypothetical protein
LFVRAAARRIAALSPSGEGLDPARGWRLALPLMSESLMPSSARVDEHDDVVVSEEDTSNRVRRLLAAWDVATP